MGGCALSAGSQTLPNRSMGNTLEGILLFRRTSTGWRKDPAQTSRSSAKATEEPFHHKSESSRSQQVEERWKEEVFRLKSIREETCSCLMGGYWTDRARLFSRMHGDKTGGNKDMLQHGKFWLDISWAEGNQHEGGQNWITGPEKLPGDIQNLTSFWVTWPSRPCCQQGGEGLTSWDPSQCKLLYDSINKGIALPLN